MNIDDLAAATQREFESIHHEFESMRAEMAGMVTKKELKEWGSSILRAIEGIDLRLSSYASRWHEDFSKLYEWTQALDSRVKFLEKTQE